MGPTMRGHRFDGVCRTRPGSYYSVETRTTGKYGARGTRFVHIEVEHALQNALLQAAALELNASVVGAFDR